MKKRKATDFRKEELNDTNKKIKIKEDPDEKNSINEEFTDKHMKIIKYVDEGHNVFFTGKAGTGKSYLTRWLIKKLEDEGKNVLICAPTGIASINVGGYTAHSLFGFRSGIMPFKKNYNIFKNYKADLWADVDVLIIDEISQFDADLFDRASELLMKYKELEFGITQPEPFGGIQVIIVGDFYQIPPISKEKASRKYCFQTYTWENLKLKCVELDHIYRQSCPTFINILNEIRVGNLSQQSINILSERIKSYDGNSDIRPTYIMSRKSDVQAINDKFLAKLKNVKEFRYKSSYKLCYISDDNKTKISYNNRHDYDHDIKIRWPFEKLRLDEMERFKKEVGRPEITIKVGAQVILKYNIDISEGLVNGLRGVVIHFEDRYPVVKFENGKIEVIRPVRIDKPFPPTTHHTFDNIYLSCFFIPLNLGWALTLHSVQGLTINEMIISMDKNSGFDYHMMYTLLSRGTDLNKIWITNFDISSIKVDPVVKDFYKRLEESISNKEKN